MGYYCTVFENWHLVFSWEIKVLCYLTFPSIVALQLARQHLDERGLPRPVLPQQHHDL